MKEKEGITAFTVVYNEEKVIERCLKSLVGVVDEIILIHDGPCDDRTLEIAKKYTKNIFVLDHRGMGELHVISALQKSNYQWVLRIDADEYLSQGLRRKIRNLIHDESTDAYGFLWKIWDGEKYITKDFPYKRVMFRKNKCYYIEFLHKALQTFGKVKELKLVLEHKPRYNNFTLDVVQKKWKKWAKIEAEYYFQEEFNTWNCSEDIKNTFVREIKNRRALANLLFCPLWFIYSFAKSFFTTKFYKSLGTWKIAFYQGIYAWYLCYYISIIKLKKSP